MQQMMARCDVSLVLLQRDAYPMAWMLPTRILRMLLGRGRVGAISPPGNHSERSDGRHVLLIRTIFGIVAFVRRRRRTGLQARVWTRTAGIRLLHG